MAKGFERNAETFRHVGQALFGEYWMPDTARSLNVPLRKVQRWYKGEHIPTGVWDDLELICSQRALAIKTWEENLMGWKILNA